MPSLNCINQACPFFDRNILTALGWSLEFSDSQGRVCTHTCNLDENLGTRFPGCVPCTSRALGWEVPHLPNWGTRPGVPILLAKESFQAADWLAVGRETRGEELVD